MKNKDYFGKWMKLQDDVRPGGSLQQGNDLFPPLNLHNFPNHTPMSKQIDLVNHPPHYTEHPSGIECIQITEHMGFNLGNALKYIWRCDLKKDAIEDLKKAVWYINRELEKRNVKST